MGVVAVVVAGTTTPRLHYDYTIPALLGLLLALLGCSWAAGPGRLLGLLLGLLPAAPDGAWACSWRLAPGAASRRRDVVRVPVRWGSHARIAARRPRPGSGRDSTQIAC